MKKEQDAAAKDTTPAAAETNVAAEATQQDGAATPAPAVHFDPDHEWPATGGCYVRQADGTLKRED